MHRWVRVVGICAAIAVPLLAQQHAERGIRLEEHAWPEVEGHLRADTVVVLPLGAAAKEHGPHLKLRNDLTIAEYLSRRVADAASVVVAPALTYHYYPAFLDYPGSTSVGLETSRDLTLDVVRSIARHGPRRFYVLNTGISTIRPLQMAQKTAATEGILLRHTDFGAAIDAAAGPYREQARGSHADEVETSLMLFIAPADVNMSKAIRDDAPAVQPFRLTRQKNGEGTYSPSGVWGDPTRATAEKGRVIVDGLVKTILGDIEQLRKETPPAPAPKPAEPTRPFPGIQALSKPLDNCTGGQLREIRALGDAYTYFWSIADADKIGDMFAPQGDIIHPDGVIERTPQIIVANRRELFARREYRQSKHTVTLTMIRCFDSEHAIADGRWSLHSVKDSAGKELPPYDGQVTLVVQRMDTAWRIQAYRFTIKPPPQPMPTWLKKPGWPGKGPGIN